MGKPQDPFHRFAWLLYSDLNNRFNILIEECAHLQDMVWGMLANLDDPLQVSDHRVQDFKRRHSEAGAGSGESGRDGHEPRSLPRWSLLPARQRDLRSLYNVLGSLYLAIETNQRTCRDSFNRFCSSWKDDRVPEPCAQQFFWFVAQRGLFVQQQFGIYADQLGDAEFKLIQIAENKPGSLPQPTLLRRWNSALYGDFLSAYSRHVDWETALFAYLEREPSRHWQAPGEVFFHKRHNEYLIHSWGHIASSRERSHVLSAVSSQIAGQPTRYHSIRSAFFYLETPILFPLLYHECAHLYLEENGSEGPLFAERERLVNRLTEAAASEPRLPQGRAFWGRLIGELWADLIAVALGGVGYVAALAAQLFGVDGTVMFETNQVPLDELAQPQHRIWDLPAVGEDTTFWDVRLRLALAACQHLHARELSQAALEWMEGLNRALKQHFAGARQVFAFSESHRRLAAYREEVADDLVTEIQTAIERSVYPRLRQFRGRGVISTAYRIDDAFAKVIGRAINDLHGAVFNEDPSPPAMCTGAVPLEGETPFDGDGGDRTHLFRIEEVSLEAKWCFAGGAVGQIGGLLRDGGDLNVVTEVYANRIRNDGSGAFRMAMEWVLARFSAIDAIADALVVSPGAGFHQWLKEVLGADGYNRLRAKAGWQNEEEKGKDQEGPDYQGGGGAWTDEDRHLLSRWLKQRNDSTNPRFWRTEERLGNAVRQLEEVRLFPSLSKWLSEHVTDPFNQNLQSGDSTGPYKVVDLGTLSLGVIAPQFVACPGLLEKARDKKGPYLAAVREVQRAFVENGRIAAVNRQIEDMRAAFQSRELDVPAPSLLPLLGEYGFLLYRGHVTPMERQHEAPARVQALLKPRAVLCLYRSGSRILTGKYGSACTDGQGGSNTSVVSVSLIEFAYRWQAHSLRDRLRALGNQDKPQFESAELFLSSGWETCILVLGLRRAEDFWSLFWEKGGLGLGCGCEHVQTYFGMPWEGFVELARHSGSGKGVEAVAQGPTGGHSAVDPEECQLPLSQQERDRWCAEFSACTGRDDFVICWKAQSVQEMFETLMGLPPSFWGSIDRLSLSCHRSFRGQVGAAASGEGHPLRFFGHVVRLGPYSRV